MIGTKSAAIDSALADAEESYTRYRAPIPTVRTGISGLVA
jgi:hypothetical protein